MYKHILVATDGSVHAQRAVDAACELAKGLGAKLSIVHVVGEGEVPDSVKHLIHAEHLADPPEIEIRSATDLGSGVGYLRTIGETGIRRHQMWAALAKQIVHNATSCAQGHGLGKINTRTEEGDPVEQLLAVIGSEKPDLLVLGRRGASGVRGLLMGSVSQKLSQLADCPVLTVK